MFSGMKKVFGGNDDEKKELVDPYFVLTFAGKEVNIVEFCGSLQFT